jgi:hypothetical protein
LTKFKVGDKVHIKTSGMTGVIKTLFPSDYWNMSDDEYGVQMDDGSGLVTIVEKVLEKIEQELTCQCGLKYARSGGRHSYWCPMSEKE